MGLKERLMTKLIQILALKNLRTEPTTGGRSSETKRSMHIAIECNCVLYWTVYRGNMARRKPDANSYWKPRPLRVLVDMDGVLCDFEGYFLEQYRKLFPDEPFIPLEERNMFYIDQQYRLIKPELFVSTVESL